MRKSRRLHELHWWEKSVPPIYYGEKHKTGHHHRCVVCNFRTGECNRRIWHKLWCPRCSRPDNSVPPVPLILID